MSQPTTSPVDDYRQVIQELERGILPLATSVDGRQFTFQASLHGLTLQTGGYVVLERDGEASFGQILTLRPDTGQAQTGSEPPGRPQVPIRAGARRGQHPRRGRPHLPRRAGASRDPGRGRCVVRRGATTPLRAGDRRPAAGTRRAGSARRRRLQPAHLHVRPVRVRQDLLPGSGPGAAAGRDQPADGHPRSQLRLRPAGRGARRRPLGRGDRGYAAAAAGRLRLAERRRGRAAAAPAVRRRRHQRRRRPCSGSTRSRTGRSTPRCPGSWPRAARARH